MELITFFCKNAKNSAKQQYLRIPHYIRWIFGMQQKVHLWRHVLFIIILRGCKFMFSFHLLSCFFLFFFFKKHFCKRYPRKQPKNRILWNEKWGNCNYIISEKLQVYYCSLCKNKKEFHAIMDLDLVFNCLKI